MAPPPRLRLGPCGRRLSKAGTLGDRSAVDRVGPTSKDVPAGSQLKQPDSADPHQEQFRATSSRCTTPMPWSACRRPTWPISRADPAGAGAGQHCLGKERVYSPNQSRADASGVAQQERDRPLVKIVEASSGCSGPSSPTCTSCAAVALLGTAGAEVSVTWSRPSSPTTCSQPTPLSPSSPPGCRRTRPSWRWATYPEGRRVEQGHRAHQPGDQGRLVNRSGRRSKASGGAQQLGVVSPEIVNACPVRAPGRHQRRDPLPWAPSAGSRARSDAA